jgi:small-conductance mechanosensitive channel
MVLRSLLKFILFICLLYPLQSWGADSAVEAAANNVEIQAPVFPGLSELSQRSTSLVGFVTKSEERLHQLSDLSKQSEALVGISEQFKKLKEDTKPLGSPDDWYVDRLTHYINQFALVRQNLDGLQQKLTLRQQEVEIIREKARKDSEFWNAWGLELTKQDVKLPKQTIAQVKKSLQQLEESLKKTSNTLLQLQEKSGELLRQINIAGDIYVQSLGKLRKATFRKNAHSFFSKDFYRQFTPELLAQVDNGFKTAITFDRSYLNEHGWSLGLLSVALVLITGLLRYHQKTLQKAKELSFILFHPLAAACFLSVIMLWIWLPAPPALFRFIVFSLAVISATSLAIPLLENRRQVWTLLFTALVIMLTSAFQLMTLPQPLFRIYLTCLSIIFIPLLIRQIYWSKKLRKSGEGLFFRAVLRLAVAVLIVSFIGQVVGYMNFSAWLIQAAFETGMVLLFVKMASMLASGCIVYTNHLLVQSGPVYFKKFGRELTLRLQRMLRVVIYTISFFYLLPTWRIFTNINDGWEYFNQLTINIGSFTLSAQMLLSAIVAFYLSIQVSWVLQGFSESHFLDRRSADRGVRDAIKKLTHYGVVLVGFLIALSFLGFGLQNLVVILGAFGIGIGFGLQDIVNNFLSGLILLFERPIKVGDGVVIDGEYGTVTRIGLRSTIVENLDQAELIVPNAQMISQKVTNWTLSTRRIRVVVPVGVAYGSDLEKVLGILKQAGEEHTEVLKMPAPTPLFIQFGNSSLDFELRIWINNVDHRPRIKNEILLYIDRRFREEGVEIPFPQHDLHLRTVASGISLGKTKDSE